MAQTDTQNVLVIAFDGLDYELIQEFELENIVQREFGTIEYPELVYKISTSELFASFITGETWKNHGIKHLKRFDKEFANDILKSKQMDWITDNIRGGYRLRKLLAGALDTDEIAPDKRYLKCESIFEEIDNSRAMFVPGYNPSPVFETGMDFLMRKRHDNEKCIREFDDRDFEIRKEKLFSELDNDIIGARDFLMCHFGRPDYHQHLYGTPEIEQFFDKDKLKVLYREIDELAERIKEKALDKGYDTVIFMSDHGLPAKNEHNRNAFYSSNTEIFGTETPLITDFHDVIIDLVERQKPKAERKID